MNRPARFASWIDACERQRVAMVRYALTETDDNMDAWNAADADEQEAFDAWSDYADEHGLCLTCAVAAFDGYAHCWEHMAADRRVEVTAEL